MCFIARRFSGIPATSASVERLFSVASLLTTRRGRTNLDSDTLFKQLLVHAAGNEPKDERKRKL